MSDLPAGRPATGVPHPRPHPHRIRARSAPAALPPPPHPAGLPLTNPISLRLGARGVYAESAGPQAGAPAAGRGAEGGARRAGGARRGRRAATVPPRSLPAHSGGVLPRGSAGGLCLQAPAGPSLRRTVCSINLIYTLNSYMFPWAVRTYSPVVWMCYQGTNFLAIDMGRRVISQHLSGTIIRSSRFPTSTFLGSKLR